MGRAQAGDVTSGEELLAVAVDAARAAGDVLLARYEGAAAAVTTKSSPTDLVSEADLEAERTIRELLRSRRPADAIMGEEGDDVAGSSGLRWIVDPLDGTVNYLFGIPQWAVSIACEDRVGVVLDPLRDELFTVVAGEAARLNGTPLPAAPRRPELGTALVATGFGYDTEVRARQAAVVARLLPRVRDIRRPGSAALDLAWTAAGRYDAFYERGVQVWDVAAGELLCRAVDDLHVRRLTPAGGLAAGILVAASTIADELAELVG